MHTVWTGFGLETVKRSCMQCWCDVTALYRAVAFACRSRGSGADKSVGFVFIVEGHSESNSTAWISWNVYSVIAYLLLGYNLVGCIRFYRMDVSFLRFIFQCVLEFRMEGILTQKVLTWIADRSKSP
jgi:hypothetical protein